MPLEYVLIVHRAPVLHTLEDQSVRSIRFDELVLSSRPPRLNFGCESLQSKDACEYMRLDSDGCGTGISFGNRPVATTITPRDRDRIRVNASPPESDQFADSQAG